MREVDILTNKAIKFNCIINEFKNGVNVLREKDLLSSAIGNCYQTMFGNDLYDSPEKKAYILFLNIARNHPFIDGNKRTASLICDYFLMEYGLELDLNTEKKFNLLINLIEKKLDVDAGMSIFTSLIKPIESINRNKITEKQAEEFTKKLNQMDDFLTSIDTKNDEKEIIINNFLRTYSSEHNINYSDLIEISHLEYHNTLVDSNENLEEVMEIK